MLSFPTYTNASQISPLIRDGIRYPITKSIKHLQPRLKWREASIRGNIIYRLAEESGIPWYTIVAVAFGESSFRHRWHEKTCGFTLEGRYDCVYEGLGEMGVNISVWGRDLAPRLLTDLEYGYIMGVRVLKGRRDLNARDPCWVGTYNSFTPKHKRRYCKKIKEIELKIWRFINEMLRL